MKRQSVFGFAAAGFLAGSSLLLGPGAWAQATGGAVAAPVAAKAEPVSLRAKWTKGDVAKYNVAMQSKRKSGVEGRDESVQTQQLLQEVRLTRRVIDTDEKGGATLSIVYERVQMNIFADKSILKFDSAAPASEDGGNELAALVRPVVGLPMTVKVDAAGNVLSIEGNEEPTPKTDADLQRASMARSLIGDEIFSKVLRPLYGLNGAPERATVGESWASEEVNDRPPIGVLTLDAKHTLSDVADGVAKITTTGTVKLSRAVGPMAVKADMTSFDIKGNAAWDVRAGSLRTYDSEQRVVLVAEDASGAKRSIDSLAKISIARVFDDKPKVDAGKP